jgi:trehalose 6-phosphate synthase
MIRWFVVTGGRLPLRCAAVRLLLRVRVTVTAASDIVIVSNRLPVHRVRRRGSSVWETSPGGLVTALTPILRSRPSTWIGWVGSTAPPPAPFDHEGIHNVPIHINRKERNAYYDGFANRTLWPLYHDAIRTPEYHRHWWHPYVEINRRFAEAAAGTAAREGTVWIHDYHLQLAPAMVRAMRPDVKVGFFLHIPFPPQELFAQLPWRRELLEGLLGADVIGFQTRRCALNFVQLCHRYLGLRTTDGDLVYDGRHVRAKEFPVSIDFGRLDSLARSSGVRERALELRRRLGSDRRIVLGVDRMDYTKGIDIRLRALQELLGAGRLTTAEFVFVQVGVPSRERVADYRSIRADVEQLIGSINGEFGELGRTPIHYLHRSLPIDELVALYRAAEVMIVTPLRDGMNLVAKEYVATRVDNTGALVLSEFTGSVHELSEALAVNPHDIDGVGSAILAALSLDRSEQERRMRAMRAVVKRYDVYRWAREFLEALAA